MLSVRFWGVRGSIPCPGPSTVEFGGNTACLEIRADDRLIIVDLGTGIRSLGDCLMDTDLKRGPIDADIFISHTHWDHIMGFPMFTPLFVSTTKLRIRGPVSYEEDTLESIIGTQLSYRYWPVRLNELAARDENERVFCFLQGADLLIHDTQYSSDEYEADKIGWGHSSYEHASDAAQKAGVKKLVFFHHDPRRTDQQLAAIESEYRARMAKTGVEIFMAREGQRIEA